MGISLPSLGLRRWFFSVNFVQLLYQLSEPHSSHGHKIPELVKVK